jgi:hypothetical protein
MVDVIQSKSDAQKIAERLKPSAGPMPDTATTQTTHGTGPTRVVHTIHHGSSQKQHGPSHSGEGNIVGGKR